MAQGCGDNVFPAYFQQWENYPSGRRCEQVTKLEKVGRQLSIVKITGPGDVVEYTVTAKSELVSEPSLVEFAGASFGRARCTEAAFVAMHAEMAALCATCLEEV